MRGHEAGEKAAPTPDATSGGEAPGGWQLIETAPKDGTEILLWTTDGLYAAAWCPKGRYGRSAGWHTYDGYEWHIIHSNPPTAWRQQPAAPHPQEKGEARS